jgi:hypothetical protein
MSHSGRRFLCPAPIPPAEASPPAGKPPQGGQRLPQNRPHKGHPMPFRRLPWMAGQLARREGQRFLTGSRSGLQGGRGRQGEGVGDDGGGRSVRGRGRHGVRRGINHPGDGFPDEGGDAAGEFRAAGVHRLCVDGRRDRPCRGAACGADGPEAAGPLGAGIAGCAGSAAAPGPDAGEPALSAGARLRHGPRTGGGAMANS